MDTKEQVSTVHQEDAEAAPSNGSPDSIHPAPYQDDDARTVRLGWRSWMVVFVTSFAIMAQVFVVVAAGSVIAFIVRDLGDAGISGWIIQVSKP